MLAKKLLTLASAAAILGFGACFLPPARGPAPPLPPYLTGVHLLAIDAEDASATEPFENIALSEETARTFMQLWDERTFRTVAQGSGLAAEARLHITILDKQATLSRPEGKGQIWILRLDTRMELVDKDGRDIWHRQDPLLHSPAGESRQQRLSRGTRAE